MQKLQNDNKPPDLKEDFNKQNEKRAFRHVNDNSKIDKEDNLEKDSDIKKEFNKYLHLRDSQRKEKASDRSTNRGTNKDTGMSRDI